MFLSVFFSSISFLSEVLSCSSLWNIIPAFSHSVCVGFYVLDETVTSPSLGVALGRRGTLSFNSVLTLGCLLDLWDCTSSVIYPSSFLVVRVCQHLSESKEGGSPWAPRLRPIGNRTLGLQLFKNINTHSPGGLEVYVLLTTSQVICRCLLGESHKTWGSR